MKKILWISESEMTFSQFADLEKLCDGVEIIHTNFNSRNEKEIIEQIKQVEMIAISQFHPKFKRVCIELAQDKPVIFPELTFFNLLDGSKQETWRIIEYDILGEKIEDICIVRHSHWRKISSSVIGSSESLKMWLRRNA